MKRLKIIMIWALLVFFLQETGSIYPVGYELLIEYATENAESREECVCDQAFQVETKKTVVIKENYLSKHESPASLPSPYPTFSVNRTIRYRTLLI